MSSALACHALRGLTALADAALGQRLSILIFHRVLPEPDPLFPAEADARRFDQLCALLARHYRVFTLGQALALRARGALPGRAVVLTFDDGYADNAEVALPILQRHGLAATFYVSTGFLDGGLMWNDAVIECLRRTPLARVDLSVLGLGVLPTGDNAARRAAIDLALPKVKYQPLQVREALLRDLRAVCQVPDLPRTLMMRSAQVLELHQAGMEIGGHTVRHPILTTLPDVEARREITEGRRVLQQITGAAVDSFAYPNGGPDRDYALPHARIAAEAGFSNAVTTAAGTVTDGADPYQLPRFSPWHAAGPRWMARLLATRVRGHRYRLAGEVVSA